MALKKRPRGRPRIDPADLKKTHVWACIHGDLKTELAKTARLEGVTESELIRNALIQGVNGYRGGVVVDKIGRHVPAAGRRM